MKSVKQTAVLMILSGLAACGGGGGGGGGGGDNNTTPPAANWTVQIGSQSADKAFAVVTDADGNIYAAVRTEGGIDGHTPGGAMDMALVKYNPAGTLQWSAQLGDTAVDTITDIAVSNDAVYITGYTTGDIDGGGPLSSYGNNDVVLAKYLIDGTYEWSIQMGTAGFDEAYAIATDGTDVYLAGLTNGDANNVGSGIYNDNVADVLVVKVLNDGSIDWVQQLGSTKYDRANGIVVQGSNVYVAGYTFGNFSGSNLGGRDVIMASLAAADGTVNWQKQYGTSGDDIAKRIVADTNRLYIVGNTRGGYGGSNAGGTCFDADDKANDTCRDVFVASTDHSGTAQWVYQAGSNGDDLGFDIKLDGNALYIAGVAGGVINGEAFKGTFDMLVMKLDTDGNHVWTRLRGSDANVLTDEAFGIAVYGSNLYVAGSSDGNFDGHKNIGGYDAYIAKFDTDGSLY